MAERPGFIRVSVIVALMLGATATGALIVQVSRDAGVGWGTGPIGALHSVMLTNGQVYYGTLTEVARNHLVFSDVYYVESVVDSKTGERNNRLVSRSANDWHGPVSMSVPIDKVVMIEVVGADSRVAKGSDMDKRERSPKP